MALEVNLIDLWGYTYEDEAWKSVLNTPFSPGDFKHVKILVTNI